MELQIDVHALLEIVNAMNACEALIQGEEHPDPITSFIDLKEHHLARQAIEDHLQSVLTYVHSTRTRIGLLPKLPLLSDALWAQALFAQPALTFLGPYGNNFLSFEQGNAYLEPHQCYSRMEVISVRAH